MVRRVLGLGDAGCSYGKGTLEGDLVALNALNGSVGDRSLAILKDRVDVDRLPGDGRLHRVSNLLWGHSGRGSGPAEGRGTDLGSGEDVLDRNSDLGANSITLNQADGEVALEEI